MEGDLDEKKAVAAPNTEGSERGTRGSIPSADRDLVPWGRNFVEWIVVNGPLAGISAAKATIVENHFGAYEIDVGNLAGGNTSPLLEEIRNASRLVFRTDCQGLIDYELRNPVLTEAQLLAAGVHVMKKTHSRDTQIVVYPENEFVSRGRNEIVARTHCAGSKSWSIPKSKGCRTIEYRGIILETENTPVPAAEDCPITGTSSTHRFVIQLGVGHSGKWFVLYVRYANHFPNPGIWGGPNGVTIL